MDEKTRANWSAARQTILVVTLVALGLMYEFDYLPPLVTEILQWLP